MRKLIIGILIMTAVMFMSLFFNYRLEKDVEALFTEIEAAYLLAEANEAANAEDKLQEALERWLDMGAYTNLLLHASKVEDVSSTFYECLNEIGSADRNNRARKEKLLYQLGSMLAQEKLTLGSIF